MNTFLKVIAGVLVAVLLSLTLSKQAKDYSFLLILVISCMVMAAAVEYLKPVFHFFWELEDIAKLDNGMLKTLLKAVGIGLLSEVTSLICTDAGNAALGKIVQYLASAVVLCISIPLFTSLLELIKSILVTT